MRTAESIAQLFNCTLVTVISGVGVRDYYEHLGYHLDKNEDQYMIKRFTTKNSDAELNLFGKSYDVVDIQSKVHNSTIVQKYIVKNDVTIQKNKGHVYKYIQNGEAEGFSFSGNLVKSTKQAFTSLIYLPIIIALFSIIYYKLFNSS
jgi:hypothetical protein